MIRVLQSHPSPFFHHAHSLPHPLICSCMLILKVLCIITVPLYAVMWLTIVHNSEWSHDLRTYTCVSIPRVAELTSASVESDYISAKGIRITDKSAFTAFINICRERENRWEIFKETKLICQTPLKDGKYILWFSSLTILGCRHQWQWFAAQGYM